MEKSSPDSPIAASPSISVASTSKLIKYALLKRDIKPGAAHQQRGTLMVGAVLAEIMEAWHRLKWKGHDLQYHEFMAQIHELTQLPSSLHHALSEDDYFASAASLICHLMPSEAHEPHQKCQNSSFSPFACAKILSKPFMKPLFARWVSMLGRYDVIDKIVQRLVLDPCIYLRSTEVDHFGSFVFNHLLDVASSTPPSQAGALLDLVSQFANGCVCWEPPAPQYMESLLKHQLVASAMKFGLDLDAPLAASNYLHLLRMTTRAYSWIVDTKLTPSLQEYVELKILPPLADALGPILAALVDGKLPIRFHYRQILGILDLTKRILICNVELVNKRLMELEAVRSVLVLFFTDNKQLSADVLKAACQSSLHEIFRFALKSSEYLLRHVVSDLGFLDQLRLGLESTSSPNDHRYAFFLNTAKYIGGLSLESNAQCQGDDMKDLLNFLRDRVRKHDEEMAQWGAFGGVNVASGSSARSTEENPLSTNLRMVPRDEVEEKILPTGSSVDPMDVDEIYTSDLMDVDEIRPMEHQSQPLPPSQDPPPSSLITGSAPPSPKPAAQQDICVIPVTINPPLMDTGDSWKDIAAGFLHLDMTGVSDSVNALWPTKTS